MLSLCTTMRTQAGAQLLYNYEASGQTLSRYITQRPQTGAQLELTMSSLDRSSAPLGRRFSLFITTRPLGRLSDPVSQ